MAPSDVVTETELTAVDHCVFVDAHPDRPGRKIPRSLEAAKVSVQLGENYFPCLLHIFHTIGEYQRI